VKSLRGLGGETEAGEISSVKAEGDWRKEEKLAGGKGVP